VVRGARRAPSNRCHPGRLADAIRAPVPLRTRAHTGERNPTAPGKPRPGSELSPAARGSPLTAYRDGPLCAGSMPLSASSRWNRCSKTVDGTSGDGDSRSRPATLARAQQRPSASEQSRPLRQVSGLRLPPRPQRPRRHLPCPTSSTPMEATHGDATWNGTSNGTWACPKFGTWNHLTSLRCAETVLLAVMAVREGVDRRWHARDVEVVDVMFSLSIATRFLHP